MKKISLCLILFVLYIPFVFAVDLSVGFRGIYERYDNIWSYDFGTEPVGYREIGNRFGGELFFDATYLQAGLGYLALVNGLEGGWGYAENEASNLDKFPSYVTFSAYLKYPIGKNKAIFFPLLGGEYVMNLTYKDGDGEDAKESLTMDEIFSLDELWVKAGMGMDIEISEGMFVRTTIMGGYRFRSRYESLMKDYIELIYKEYSMSLLNLDFEATIGLGFKL